MPLDVRQPDGWSWTPDEALEITTALVQDITQVIQDNPMPKVIPEVAAQIILLRLATQFSVEFITPQILLKVRRHKASS